MTRLLFLLFAFLFLHVAALPLRRQAGNPLSQPTTLQTTKTQDTAAGQMTTTCEIKLTPVKDQNGNDAVEEVTTCKISMNGGTNNGANGSAQSSSASQGGSTSTTAASGAASGGSSDSQSSSSSSGTTTTSSDSSGATSAADSASSAAGVSSAAVTSSAGSSGSSAVAGAPVQANGVSSIDKSVVATLLSSGSSGATATSSAGSTGATAAAAVSSGTSTAQSASAAAAQDSSSASPSAAGSFELPGKKLSVLPIGLGVFAGISVIALIVVGLVTYERTKYRKAFRQRKLAEQGAAMGYSGNMAERT